MMKCSLQAQEFQDDCPSTRSRQDSSREKIFISRPFVFLLKFSSRDDLASLFRWRRQAQCNRLNTHVVKEERALWA
jgi:hypothetical protein